MDSEHFDLLRQQHEARQLQLMADINQLKSELAHERSVSAQLNNSLMTQTNAHANDTSQLQASLAAAQLRTEQLTQINTDNKAELYDLRNERRNSQMQLDAARHEFFSLQRQNQTQKEELIRMQSQFMERQGAYESKIETLKAAINGVSGLNNFRNGGFSAAVSALVESGNDKELFLAKIAMLTNQNDELLTQNVKNETQIKQLKVKIKQYQHSFEGNNVPSVKILMEQVEQLNEEKEVLEDEVDTKAKRMVKMKHDIQELISENKKLRATTVEMKQNFRNLQDIREQIREMIDDEMNE
ncbi:hypothetical protein SS50377_27529 [Spironucleus salmonicida]|uniref:Uncharacterized protein n=1 Tax=Spironucleus salmonicida TaxID=348837 RepID=V6LRI5_9EUKA|nr:hypothetical protein SS50377_27528 [Spironucleus salmonicida]KAH0571229.1 hypothetical protein SS50377_27529 [Spironucleus salmonicida]|eukprot:EST46878.1 hypothetical protein SS50377_13030 [Spironucleus salmonicida]